MRSNRIIAIAGWIVAGIALATCIGLGMVVKQRLSIEQRLRADPLGLRTLDSIEQLPASPRLLLTGDSRAAQLRTPGIEGWSVINRGIPGQSTPQVAARFGRDLLLLNPDHAVVIAGINDLKDGDTLDRISQTIEGFRDIARMAEAAGVPLTIVEVWGAGDVTEPRRLLLPADLTERLVTVNDAIRGMSTPSSCRVIRADALLADDAAVPEAHARDTLHLNAEGNRILAGVIDAALPPIETKDD